MAYLTHVFGNTDVEITEDERIILVEPEFLHGLLPLLIATPERVQGKYIDRVPFFSSSTKHPFSQILKI